MMKAVDVMEFVTTRIGGKVDRTRSVISGVKLIGPQSRNGRTYPLEVLKASAEQYEGVRVNIDHPEKSATQPRSALSRFGIIRNAKFVEGKGVFGDLHFNPKHPAAEQIVWAAENDPESLGLSHNAALRLGLSRSGSQTVEAIVRVRSVDIVADPATTNGMFESEGQATRSVAEIRESLARSFARNLTSPLGDSNGRSTTAFETSGDVRAKATGIQQRLAESFAKNR